MIVQRIDTNFDQDTINYRFAPWDCYYFSINQVLFAIGKDIVLGGIAYTTVHYRSGVKLLNSSTYRTHTIESHKAAMTKAANLISNLTAEKFKKMCCICNSYGVNNTDTIIKSVLYKGDFTSSEGVS